MTDKATKGQLDSNRVESSTPGGRKMARRSPQGRVGGTEETVENPIRERELEKERKKPRNTLHKHRDPGTPILLGCDFSCAPSRRKPVVLALGREEGGCVLLERLETFETLQSLQRWLAVERAWIGGFDLPFGLPRELVEALGWPLQWAACMDLYTSLTRAQIRGLLAAFCDARPSGSKLAHRATDRPAGSSPSMRWVNPPVALMMHAGVALLRSAGVHMPGLVAGDPTRVALEAYPGLLARELIGAQSYKSDERKRQTPERTLARRELLGALEQGSARLGLALALTVEQRELLVEDASGDRLDAVLCLVQAAWGARQGAPLYGLPEALDPLEGWIVTAPLA